MFFGLRRAGFDLTALAQASARTQFFAATAGHVSSPYIRGDLGEMCVRLLLFKGVMKNIFD
jgi:hypothetical protein